MTGTNLTRLSPSGGALTAGQLDLIKRTVAKDTSATEFDHFMHTSSSLGLDPLRKQIVCVVFNKDKPDKRNMTIIVTVDGQRVIAARQGDYGPEREEPAYVADDAIKSPINPQGLVSASVKLWKRYEDGWQPVAGQAYWDEFAPIEEEWAWDADKNRRAPTGQKKLADNWKRMPRLMLAKCARAQALRAGWPDAFSGLYTEEEMQKAIVLDDATAMLEQYGEHERLTRVGKAGQTLTFLFDPRGALEVIPRAEIAERVERWLHSEVVHPNEITEFRRRNKDALQVFWGWEAGDALALKRMMEERQGELAIRHGLAGGEHD